MAAVRLQALTEHLRKESHTFARCKDYVVTVNRRCLMFLQFTGGNEGAAEFLCGVFKVGDKPQAS